MCRNHAPVVVPQNATKMFEEFTLWFLMDVIGKHNHLSYIYETYKTKVAFLLFIYLQDIFQSTTAAHCIRNIN